MDLLHLSHQRVLASILPQKELRKTKIKLKNGFGEAFASTRVNKIFNLHFEVTCLLQHAFLNYLLTKVIHSKDRHSAIHNWLGFIFGSNLRSKWTNWLAKTEMVMIIPYWAGNSSSSCFVITQSERGKGGELLSLNRLFVLLKYNGRYIVIKVWFTFVRF